MSQPDMQQPEMSCHRQQANQLPIILASTSPYRKQLLDRLYLDYQPCQPDFAEIIEEGSDPHIVAVDFAEGKARSLAMKFARHLIIGSDQTAAVNGEILTKPGTRAGAIEQLLACSGKNVIFSTAVVLLNSRANRLQKACEEVSITFRKLALPEIERYVDADSPIDCCGSFKIESLGISLMSSVTSGDPTALVGLPLITLAAMLRQEAYEIP